MNKNGNESNMTEEPSNSFNRTRPLCSVCSLRSMRYSCPKCNKPYCSTECYQGHSSQCTESFYRESIEKELKAKRAGPREEARIKKILEQARVQQEKDASTIEQLAKEGSLEDIEEASDLNNEFDEDLLELAALDLNDPNFVERIPESQLAKFHKLLSDGSLSKLITPWIPWWTRESLSPKITVVSQESDTIDTESESHDDGDEDSEELESLIPAEPPKIHENIPLITSLTRIKPSPLIANNVVEIIYSYAYTKRLYNGDWDDENGIDALGTLLELSGVLRENRIFRDVHAACRAPFEASFASVHSQTSIAFATSLLDDVAQILSRGVQFLLAALSDVHDFISRFSALKANETKDKKNKQTSKPIVTLAQMEKKLLFLLSWTNEPTTSKLLPDLAAQVKSFKSEHLDHQNFTQNTDQSQESQGLDVLNFQRATTQEEAIEQKGPKIVELN